MPFNRKLEPTKAEVDALMNILTTALEELPVLQKNNVRLNAIGNIGSLPEKANKKLISVINATSGNDGLAWPCIELRLTS